ncbi:MAG: hypothetical protein ABSE73_01385 [Planctomycetota bacterium]
MAMYEVTFWDGSIDEVEADDIKDARDQAKDLNESGVKKVVFIGDEDDEDEDDKEDENPDDEEDD